MSEQPANIIECLKQNRFTAPAQPLAGQPYGFTMRSWNRGECGDMATWEKFVRLHQTLGYNSIVLDLSWADIEGKRGSYDFTGYDPYLRSIANAGLGLQLKLNSRMMPSWATANRDALLCGSDGQVLEEGSAAPTPYHGFADPHLIEALQMFYEKVAGHCRGLPNLFYVSAFSCSFESEYHHTIWTDYSPAAQRQMREYLRTAYSSLDRLNAAWLTTYATWNDVTIAWQPPETMRDGRPEPRYVDFMKYREWAGRRFFDAMHAAIKDGDPNAEYGPQVGRIVCPVGMLRGTIGAFNWAENCEWIFVDPAPVDDFAWELAIARAGGKKVAVELDGPDMFRRWKVTAPFPALYAEQTRACYEHGANYVCHANWDETRDYVQSVEGGLYERAAAAKGQVFDIPPASDAVYVGKWDSYLRKHIAWTVQPDQVLELSKARFQDLRHHGKPVDVVLDDTILPNPDKLKQYANIHLCGAKFIAQPVWEALRKSGATLVFGPGTQGLRDETGSELPS